jgi:hypothetical protein
MRHTKSMKIGISWIIMNSIVIKNAIMNLINLKLPYKVMKYLVFIKIRCLCPSLYIARYFVTLNGSFKFIKIRCLCPSLYIARYFITLYCSFKFIKSLWTVPFIEVVLSFVHLLSHISLDTTTRCLTTLKTIINMDIFRPTALA